jgi:hypothetical protein
MAFGQARRSKPKTRNRRARASCLALLGAAVSAGIGCGTAADGTDACKQVEEARCRQATACSISLEPPYHSSGTDVDGCIRFYDVACLHGLEVGDPGPTVVRTCVKAIETNGCTTVSAPETDPACAWLAPVPTGSSDAGEGMTLPADASIAE